MKTNTKLIRNVKPGEKILLRTQFTGHEENSGIFTVESVQEIDRGVFSGNRRWRIEVVNPPWWYPIGPSGDSTERVTVVR